MSTLVRKTIQFIQEECEESWKPEHAKVMRDYHEADCSSEAAQIYKALFDQLKASIESEDNDSFDLVLCHCETLDMWYRACSELLERIEQLEAKEFNVDFSDPIRRCHGEAAMMLEDLHDAKNAIEAVQEGRSISVEDYIDELRNPVHR